MYVLRTGKDVIFFSVSSTESSKTNLCSDFEDEGYYCVDTASCLVCSDDDEKCQNERFELQDDAEAEMAVCEDESKVCCYENNVQIQGVVVDTNLCKFCVHHSYYKTRVILVQTRANSYYSY